MKKLLQILAMTLIVLAPFGAGTVSAQECTISDTGPDSKNECIIKDEHECTVINDNEIKIDGKNMQFSKSGDAEVEDNTNAGSAITGTATNSNNQTFRVTITNGSCVAEEEEEEEVVTPPVTPTQPGGGGGLVGGRGQVGAVSNTSPTVLPETSSNISKAATALVSYLGVGTVIASISAIAFRRSHL